MFQLGTRILDILLATYLQKYYPLMITQYK